MANLDYFYPFDSVDGDRKTTAATERRFWGGLFTDGVVGAGGFPITGDGGVYAVGEGLAIVGGAVGGLVSARSVTAKPAAGVKQYIVLRLDTTAAVRSMALEVVSAPESATDEQLENGGVRDLPLYAVEGLAGGGYGLLDLREYCRSFDNAIYSQDFQKLYDATQAEATALLDAARVSFAAAIAEANAENAGLYGSAGRQGFINPLFEVNQRGGSAYWVAEGRSYIADHWFMQSDGLTVPEGITARRIIDGSGRRAVSVSNNIYKSGSAPSVSYIAQNIEGGVRTFCHGGKSFTVSFDAKADAAQSVAVEATQFAATGGAGVSLPVQRVNVTPEWQRFSVIFEGSVDIAELSSLDVLQIAFCFAWRDNSAKFGDDQDAANVVYFANMQVNEGTAALPCYAKPYADELEACQRYFVKLGKVSLSVGATLATGNQVITSPLPITRRLWRTPSAYMLDRAGADGASVEIASGGWRNGLACELSNNSEDAPVFVVTNTDASAVTRVCFDSLELNAEIMD